MYKAIFNVKISFLTCKKFRPLNNHFRKFIPKKEQKMLTQIFSRNFQFSSHLLRAIHITRQVFIIMSISDFDDDQSMVITSSSSSSSETTICKAMQQKKDKMDKQTNNDFMLVQHLINVPLHLGQWPICFVLASLLVQ